MAKCLQHFVQRGLSLGAPTLAINPVVQITSQATRKPLDALPMGQVNFLHPLAERTTQNCIT